MVFLIKMILSAWQLETPFLKVVIFWFTVFVPALYWNLGKGSWDEIKYEKNQQVMINLWQQICEIADFDKNNEVDTEEFMKGVETACKNKTYDQLPEAFKFFIEAQFRTIDVDGKKS